MISEDSQCRLYFFDGLQNSGPFGDASDFARIDAKGFTVKQETQIFYACLFEDTFLRFEEEGFLFEKIKNVVDNLSMEGGVIWSGD